MKIAYLILAHRYPEQLLRLVCRLQTNSCLFFIHLDKKMDKNEIEFIKQSLSSYSNVYYIKQYACYWGGFGIIRATMRGIKEIITKNYDFDYIALLSGQDYPIKTNKCIEEYLSGINGKSVINCRPFPISDWKDQGGGWNRIKQWYFQDAINKIDRKLSDIFRRIISLLNIQRNFPNAFHPYGGAQFWCLYKEHAIAVNRFIQNNRSFVHFFRYVYVPDEIFFQTIVGNLLNQSQFIDNTLHFLEWYRPGAILCLDDFNSIKSADFLFARKFDASVDTAIMDKIDKEILLITN